LAKTYQRWPQRSTKLGRVVGVGITRVGDGYGVKVNLQAQPGPSVKLPEKVEGVPVRVEVVGTLLRE
jgi:hypothetical protein